MGFGKWRGRSGRDTRPARFQLQSASSCPPAWLIWGHRTFQLPRRQSMQCFRSIASALVMMSFACRALAAEPEYVTIKLDIDIAKPAAEVWARVGDYCDIGEWAKLECVITSGDDGIGTVRVLGGGRATEIMVAQTELSYGYTQPAVEGQFYNL